MQTMINFLKYRGITALLSFGLFVAFGGVAYYRYQSRGHVFSYSIDFTGGTQVLLKFDKTIDSVQVKDIIVQKGWQSPAVREFGKNEILVRVKEFESDAKGLGLRMKEALNEQLPDYSIEILQSESVGPGVGAELRWKSMRTVLIALIIMLAYIAFRFWSFGYAAGAVAALFHDAIIMIALFLFLDREISINVIAAVLAVLGYSINDTIVIFSQIRDFRKSMKGALLDDIVNTSLTHTLKRTLLTSISTGLPVIIMLVFGGEALQDFSLTLLAGIIFGTYSSIYIASPVMMLLSKKQ